MVPKKKINLSETQRYVHLIDHDGAIFRLISPLCIYPEHTLMTSFDSCPLHAQDVLYSVGQKSGTTLILHATGRHLPFYMAIKNLIRYLPNILIFMHVSASYLKFRDRYQEIAWLSELSSMNRQIRILTPSKEVAVLYNEFGVKSLPIQIGIKQLTKIRFIPDNRWLITTICTESDDEYQFVKGIDRFIAVVKELGLETKSLILGHDGSPIEGIKRKAVSPKECNNLIAQSRVYVQLSRSEAYNITAIEAKRLRVPVIASDVEGHKDNIRYGFKANTHDDVISELKSIYFDSNVTGINEVIDANYKDSTSRETLNQFRRSWVASLDDSNKLGGVL